MGLLHLAKQQNYDRISPSAKLRWTLDRLLILLKLNLWLFFEANWTINHKKIDNIDQNFLGGGGRIVSKPLAYKVTQWLNKLINSFRMSNARYLPRANERYPLIAEGVIGVAFRRFGHHPRTGKGALTGMGRCEEKVLDGRIANKMTLGEAVVRGVLRALMYGGAADRCQKVTASASAVEAG